MHFGMIPYLNQPGLSRFISGCELDSWITSVCIKEMLE